MTDSRRPRAYYAAHTYEAQRRALALDFRDGHTVEVQRLCRSGKTALIMLERAGVAKRTLQHGRALAKRTFLARHPLINLGIRLLTAGLRGCRW